MLLQTCRLFPFLAQREEEELLRRAEEGRALSELDSTKAFAAFLSKRANYSVPVFLNDVIQIPAQAQQQQQQQQQEEQKQKGTKAPRIKDVAESEAASTPAAKIKTKKKKAAKPTAKANNKGKKSSPGDASSTKGGGEKKPSGGGQQQGSKMLKLFGKK